ncbi:MAG: AMMECR1 domain-containing protein [Rhodospirillaceae bacterium]|nr:AMMECR1 domain-containing protein [Rhodospirillaceae bacterium]
MSEQPPSAAEGSGQPDVIDRMPDDPDGLRSWIADHLAVAGSDPVGAYAIWVPPPLDHASAAVAAAGYAAVARPFDPVMRVVVVGRAASATVAPLTLLAADALVSPLGPVPADGEAAAWLDGLPGLGGPMDGVAADPDLAAQLAFVRHCFPDAVVAAVAVGDQAEAAQVAGLLERVAGTPGALAVVNGDACSHAGEGGARLQAELFADWMESGGHAGARPEDAGPLRAGFFAAAKPWRVTRASIGAGPAATGARGLAALVAEPVAYAELAPGLRARLHRIARASVENAARYQPPQMIDRVLGFEAWSLQAIRPVFVMAPGHGHQRRESGTWQPTRPLAVEVAHHANRVVIADPIVPRPSQEDARTLALRIAVLSVPERLTAASETEVAQQLNPEVDGLVLRRGNRQAVLMPDVWADQRYTPSKAVSVTKQRIGLRSEAWADDIEAYRFVAEFF